MKTATQTLTRIFRLALALYVLILSPVGAAHAMELVMVERDGCAYCARWNAEIAPIYPKTPEGAYAPLRRVDLPALKEVEFVPNGPVIFTPTFLLIEDGKELARIEGYAGDEMFWAMLSVTLRDHTDFDAETLPPQETEAQAATN